MAAPGIAMKTPIMKTPIMKTRSPQFSSTLPLSLALLGVISPIGLGERLMVNPAVAASCASRCTTKPLQFAPGQRIQVQVWNRTGSTIELENAGGDREIRLMPGQKIKFYRGGSTDPNLSVVFWETTETPLKATLSKPKPDLLEVDLTFAATRPGDRSIYIRNDGQIDKL
jgi:hypothetical protein